MTFVGDRALGRLRALSGDPLGDSGKTARFELGFPIAEGGMGVVWAGWDRETEREVAIKILRAEHENERAAERFAREAEVLARLSHPAIVRHVAQGTMPDGARMIVMERLVGESLAARLRRGPLGISETVALGRRVADALACVHENGVVHRDVKPSNLFLVGGDPSAVKLLDFGLARARDGVSVTRVGALVGTPGYMSPEQVRGARPAGPSADVFGLGCVLFECLAGRPAFFGDGPEAVLAKILLEAPPRLRARRPDVPRALEALVAELLAKNDSERPDASTVSRRLGELDAVVASPPRRALLLVAGSAVATFAVLSLAAVFVWRGQRSEAPPASEMPATAPTPTTSALASAPVIAPAETAEAPAPEDREAPAPPPPPRPVQRAKSAAPSNASTPAPSAAEVAPKVPVASPVLDPRHPALESR